MWQQHRPSVGSACFPAPCWPHRVRFDQYARHQTVRDCTGSTREFGAGLPASHGRSARLTTVEGLPPEFELHPPERFKHVQEVEEAMSRPSTALIDTLARVPGDIMVLGVGGKIGPTLARMAKRADPGR